MSSKAILCVITEDGQIDNAVIDIPLGMKQEELDYLAQRVTNLLHGTKLVDVSEKQIDELHDNLANDKLLFTSLLQAIKQMQVGQN